MRPEILVLAAGMGSRYGGNKQLDAVGPNGETIIDYSIYDAKRAGFGRIVFVIRRDIEEMFVEQFVRPMKGIIEIDYVFQDLDDLPGGLKAPSGRVKPWGTGHAVLVAKNSISEPFGVINSDDYYGVDSFRILYDFLSGNRDDSIYCIVGYKMGNTLSDHGDVNRGVCKVDSNNRLSGIIETRGIVKDGSEIFAPDSNGKLKHYDKDDIVSMNLWGFKPSCFGYLENAFINFLNAGKDDLKAELDIPTSVDDYVQKGELAIDVLMTDEKWMGVTYREDKPFVVEGIRKMIQSGIYPEKLWS